MQVLKQYETSFRCYRNILRCAFSFFFTGKKKETINYSLWKLQRSKRYTLALPGCQIRVIISIHIFKQEFEVLRDILKAIT